MVLLIYASRLLRDTEVLITNTLGKEKSLRTAHQALLAIRQAREAPDDIHDGLLGACGDYWQKYCRKAYCFEDIKNSLSWLDQQRRQKFLDQLSSGEFKDSASGTNHTSDSTMPTLNLLKLRYCFSLPVGSLKEQLENFVCDALGVYRISIDGSSPCPEAALLAAMALVRLAFAGLAEAKSAPRHDQYLL